MFKNKYLRIHTQVQVQVQVQYYTEVQVQYILKNKYKYLSIYKYLRIHLRIHLRIQKTSTNTWNAQEQVLENTYSSTNTIYTEVQVQLPIQYYYSYKTLKLGFLQGSYTRFSNILLFMLSYSV